MQESKLQDLIQRLLQDNGNSKLESLKELKLETIYGWQDTFSKELEKNLELMSHITQNLCKVIGMDQVVTLTSQQSKQERKEDIITSSKQ